MTPTLTDADRATIAAAWVGVGSAPNLARDLQAAAERTYLAGLAAGMERERERCARLCDELMVRWRSTPDFAPPTPLANVCAAAIRASAKD